ncbi:MAG: HAD hydrolase-like protein [Lachnospiraceae bacterium]|nr:HAD hydrolase-like protein [Lachnospiraceae bacterium]
MYKNILFDLDGTLLDTTEGILISIRYTIEKLGLKQLDEETIKTFIGPPVQDSFRDKCGTDEKETLEATRVFRDHYSNETLFMARPYDGIFELCEKLRERGTKMAVATYKREDYALKLLKHFGFDRWCDPMHGADADNVLKKDDIVRMCISEMGADAAETALVGDTRHDGLGAKKAGVGFIAVTYGFGFKKKEDADGYDCVGVAENPLEILKFLVDK